MPGALLRIRDAFARFIGVFRSRHWSSRLDEEMRFHVDMAAERNARLGMAPDEATRAAHLAFGAREKFREESRDEYRSRPLDEITKDVHYALRTLRRQPSLAATVVLTLALGIGALTTVFSVVNTVLLKPLPYASSDRLVTISQRWEGRAAGPGSLSPAETFDYFDELRSFDAVGVYTLGVSTLVGDGEPVRVPRALVSAGVLTALGVQPQLGHAFTLAEDAPGASDVVIIGGGLWQSRFGGDPGVIGRNITVDGASATIVGVLPTGFRLPDEMSAPDHAQIFRPMRLNRADVKIRGSHGLSSVARVRSGVTMAQANADVAGVLHRFAERFPADYPAASNFGTAAVPLQASVVGSSGTGLWLLLGAVLLVLLIACVNAASLLLARADARRAEIAIRTAMGAGRARLMRQLLVESLLLALIAGATGVLFAQLATSAFVRFHPIALPRLAELTVDVRALAFALGITLASAIASGLAPALQLARRDVHLTLRSAGRGGMATTRRRALRRLLVAGEIAMTVVLLVGASLLGKSFWRLMHVDPGFVVDHALTTQIAVPRGTYDADDKVIAFFAQLTERARTLPGVHAAGAVAGVPLVAARGDIGIEFEGHPIPPGTPHPKADWQVVTPGYFRAIGMRLLQGREIDGTDLAATPGVVVVNATMAQRYWPAGDALGKRFKLGGGAKPDTATVIGIVADVHQTGLGSTPEPEMYLAHAQFRFWGGGGVLGALTLVLRTDGDPMAYAAAVRKTIRELAPTVPIGTVQSMETLRSASVAEQRFVLVLLALASLIAFVIAAVGLYGTVAYTVAQRRKEFGVRVALGAQRSDIVRLVLGESLLITAGGVFAGLPLAVGGGHLLERFLFGVRATDPAMLSVVPALLAVVTLVAAYIPARRAARGDPLTALRLD